MFAENVLEPDLIILWHRSNDQASPADGGCIALVICQRRKGRIMCDHKWVANSGRGGDPSFRLNRQMSNVPVMHVTCAICGARTWLTEAQWLAR